MSSLKVAMIQMLVEGGHPGANLNRAVSGVREAAARGAGLAVLPECMDLGWTDPSALTLARPVPGEYSYRLAEAARTQGIYVAAGLVERYRDVLYNAAVLIGPDGTVLCLHRKINELDIAHHLYAPGNQLSVADTAFGKAALSICADNFSESLAIGHVLARMGAQILISPSAWAVDADHDDERDPYGSIWLNPYRELSRLYDLPVVGVSGVGRLTAGPWVGRKLIGCSMAVDSDGSVAAQAPYGESAQGILIADLTLRPEPLQGTLILDELRRRGYSGP